MVGSHQGYVQCQAFALIFHLRSYKVHGKKTELSIHLLRLIRNLFVIYLDWTGSSSPEQQHHTQKYLLTNSHLANAHYSVHCSVNKWLAGFFELPCQNFLVVLS